jgi:methyl-accepting chemotaxis protein
VPAADLYGKGKDAFVALAGVYDKALPALDGRLAARVDGFSFNRNLEVQPAGLVPDAGLVPVRLFDKVLHGGLKEVAFHIDAMRDGDLTTRPRAWGADEAAGLMGTLTQMQESLRNIVTQVRGASDGIVSASTQISSGAQDLSTRTEQSASSLQETASAMEQIAVHRAQQRRNRGRGHQAGRCQF